MYGVRDKFRSVDRHAGLFDTCLSKWGRDCRLNNVCFYEETQNCFTQDPHFPRSAVLSGRASLHPSLPARGGDTTIPDSVQPNTHVRIRRGLLQMPYQLLIANWLLSGTIADRTIHQGHSEVSSSQVRWWQSWA